MVSRDVKFLNRFKSKDEYEEAMSPMNCKNSDHETEPIDPVANEHGAVVSATKRRIESEVEPVEPVEVEFEGDMNNPATAGHPARTWQAKKRKNWRQAEEGI